MSGQFQDQVVLVTGAGAGIGQATARAFAREGAAVVVAGRTPDRLAETVELIQDDGGDATAIPTDVTQANQVARLVSQIVDRHGRLHVAVNNAGILSAAGFLADLGEEQWAEMLTTNVTGTWLSMKHEITHMRDQQDGGRIVNIASSIGAHLTLPAMGAYAASKAAVSTLTRTAAKEYIRAGIRINAVSPGPVDTPMSRFPGETDADRDARLVDALPIGRVATTEEIARVALWLASEDASFVVGHDLVVDGAGTP